jgi:steroid delta-isomerase-like uncharacterized protein
MTANDAKRLISDYTAEVWNRGQMDQMSKYYGEGYRHHDASRPDVTTFADYQQWGRDLLAAFPQMEVVIDDIVADTNGTAVKRWTVRGVHKGAIAGIAPTGKSIQFSGFSMYRFDGSNRIVESWYVYDLFGLLSQLGAIPAPAAA